MNTYILRIFTLAWALAVTGIVNAQKITITLAGSSYAGYSGENTPGSMTNISGLNDVCRDDAGNIYYIGGTLRKISASNGRVTTIAGGGTSMADNIPATDANLGSSAAPYLCIDHDNNIYVSLQNRIRKINLVTGIITTIAGGIVAGYGGDGGPATAAVLSGVKGVSSDAVGNIYLVDADNNRIRKISAATGIITTIAGTGGVGYSGDGGAATTAILLNAIAIRVNNIGDVYFSDQNATRIRKIDASTGIISLFAGNGAGTIASSDNVPAISTAIGTIYGIAIDNTGNVYVNDASCACRKIDIATGIIKTVAGSLTSEGYNGDGLNSLLQYFNWPHGICLDETGSIYVADWMNNRVRKAIQLTHNPIFGYGKTQYINRCQGYSIDIDRELSVGDLDSAQNENWSIVSPPVHGSLSGFPYSKLSVGTDSFAVPDGFRYIASGAFTGNDSFKVRVTDGTLSDTVTIYALGDAPFTNTHSISGNKNLCLGSSVNLTTFISGGVWTRSNSNAMITASGMITALLEGLDTIRYATGGTCEEHDTIIVFVDHYLDAGTISGVNHVYTGSTTLLTSILSGGVIATGGVWESGNTAIATISSTGLVTGVSPGTVQITFSATSNTGCRRETHFTVTVIKNNFPEGLNDISQNGAHVIISPNPAGDHFTINVFSAGDESVTITMTDLMGKQLTRITGNTNEPISVAGLNVPSGIYLLNIHSASVNATRKVVIER